MVFKNVEFYKNKYNSPMCYNLCFDTFYLSLWLSYGSLISCDTFYKYRYPQYRYLSIDTGVTIPGWKSIPCIRYLAERSYWNHICNRRYTSNTVLVLLVTPHLGISTSSFAANPKSWYWTSQKLLNELAFRHCLAFGLSQNFCTRIYYLPKHLLCGRRSILKWWTGFGVIVYKWILERLR